MTTWHSDMGDAPHTTLPDPHSDDIRMHIFGLAEDTPCFRLWWSAGVLTFGMAAEQRVWVTFKERDGKKPGQYLIDPEYTLYDGYIECWRDDGPDLVPRYLTVSRAQALNVGFSVIEHQALPATVQWH